MPTTTIYDVKIRYLLDNKASGGLKRLTTEADKAAQATNKMSLGLGRLAAGIVAAFGVRAAGKALISFNASAEDTKIQIAGMLALVKKTDFADQVQRADRLFANLQRRAKTLPGTTAEYTKMAGLITQPIMDAGGSMRDLEDLTVNAVVAAKALGIEAEVAARDIDQALRGQFHSVDVFTGKLLGSMGFKGEEGRAKFNAMGAGQRSETLKAALMQKQITQLAGAQGASFTGMLSTLQDTIQQFFGKVGVPLFKTITAEIKSWNTWMDANQGKVDRFAARVGDALVTGFKFVRDAVGFLVDHADTIIAIGKVWAAVAIGSKIGSMAGGIASWGSGLMDKAGGKVGGGLKGIAGAAPSALAALAGGFAVGSWIEDNAHIGRDLGRAFADLTGQTSQYARELEGVRRSTTGLDNLINEANDRAAGRKGFQATRGFAGLDSMRAMYSGQANAVADFQRDIATGDMMTRAGAYARYKAQLEAAGGTTAEIGAMGGPLSSKTVQTLRDQATQMDVRAQQAAALGQVGFTTQFAALTDFQKKTLDVEKAQTEIFALVQKDLARGIFATDPMAILGILRGNTEDPEGKRKPDKMSSKPKVNVTIQRIEVVSDDPDRIAFGLVDAFRDLAKNPSSAVDVLREG